MSHFLGDRATPLKTCCATLGSFCFDCESHLAGFLLMICRLCLLFTVAELQLYKSASCCFKDSSSCGVGFLHLINLGPVCWVSTIDVFGTTILLLPNPSVDIYIFFGRLLFIIWVLFSVITIFIKIKLNLKFNCFKVL